MRRLFLVLIVLGGCQANEEEVPFRAPSIPLGQMDARQQATYFAAQGIQATGGGPDGGVRTFTPTAWDGFSVDPTGAISYIDYGAFVMMWADAAIVGTSDFTNFTLHGVPTTLIPSRLNTAVGSFGMLNNATGAGGSAIVYGGASGFAGQIHFFILRTDTVANFATPNANGWTNVGNKGLDAGWIIQYPK